MRIRFQYLSLMIPIAIIAFLTIFPLVYTLYASFQRWDWKKSSDPQGFVGIDNFQYVLTNKRVQNSLKVTFTIMLPTLALQTLIGFGIAFLIYKKELFHRFVQGLFVIVALLPEVLIGFSWRFMLNDQFGLIDYLTDTLVVRPLGIEPFLWLGSPLTATASIIMADVWHWTPFVALIFSAGIASLPLEPVEAATVDGATGWQIFRHITFPLLKPLLWVVVLIRAIGLFKLFDKVALLTWGGPGTATEVISAYLYRLAFRFFRFDYAAAFSIIIMIMCDIIFTIYVKRLVFRE